MANNRKKEILYAAIQCFMRYGYDKTTLEDIGSSVGMNKVSLYYYFKNKEAIFSELILKEADDCSIYLETKANQISDYKERIITWIKDGFNYKDKNSILQILSPESIKQFSPHFVYLKQYAKNKGTQYLESILEDEKNKKTIIACDIKKIAEIIQDVIYSMKDYYYSQSKLSQHTVDNLPINLDKIILTVALILDGIAADKNNECIKAYLHD